MSMDIVPMDRATEEEDSSPGSCEPNWLPITACYHPPETSKWDKIEYRMFSFINMNWNEKKLVNYEDVVELICSTEIKTALKPPYSRMKINIPREQNSMAKTWKKYIRTKFIPSEMELDVTA